MNVSNCTPNELAAAMMAFLKAGAGSTAPLYVRDGTWLSGRADTKAAFADHFPGMMSKTKTKKGKAK
jgi:hypothetical protein